LGIFDQFLHGTVLVSIVTATLGSAPRACTFAAFGGVETTICALFQWHSIGITSLVARHECDRGALIGSRIKEWQKDSPDQQLATLRRPPIARDRTYSKTALTFCQYPARADRSDRAPSRDEVVDQNHEGDDQQKMDDASGDVGQEPDQPKHQDDHED
jgi:hypothetical protein